jgi:predicted ATPase/class 3 adenylate cyclase
VTGTAVQPTGTITLLFSDIEGSTRLLQHSGPERYAKALNLHRRLLRDAFERHGGYEVDYEGDAFFVAFARAEDAVAAAVEAQQGLAEADWPDGQELRVRMGIHTGEPLALPPKYVGLDVHQAARIMAAGHGGQVLLSRTTRDLVGAAFSVRELGEHRLKDLSAPKRLYQLLVEGLPSEFPALKTLGNRPTNLPVQPTPLIGRGRELAELTALLCAEGVRLVTLTGPGGTGKTRLALQAAANLIDEFEDGVFFVELAAITAPELVPTTVAQTLGLREIPGEPLEATLQGYLAEKQMLLVMDNFEHLLTGAPMVRDLLGSAAGLRVLATSRASLHLSGEHEYSVPPLALGASGDEVESEANEAVTLFLERARAVKRDFRLTAESGAVVAEICARLDGLPLAIELAAARVKVFPPEALLPRLEQRLQILTGGSRDLEKRQQTLRSTLDWSYDLLETADRTLFARLAVFAGGRTIEAVEAICGSGGELDVLESITSLIDKSLLQQQLVGPESRFVMLETIHEYARELLDASGETAQLRRRHADYFAGLAGEAAPQLRGPEQQTWIERLAAEQDNLRAALTFLIDEDEFPAAQSTAVALALFWETRGQFQEAHEWFTEVLGEPDFASSKSRGQAFFWAGRLALFAGAWERAARLLRSAAEVANEVGDATTVALALGKQSWVLVETGNGEEGLEQADRALALARQLGDDWTIAEVLNDAALSNDRTDPERGLHFLQESLAVRRSLGDHVNVADSLNNLGYVQACLGAYDLAEGVLEEGLEIAQQIGDLRHIALIIGNLANVSLFRGDADVARSRYQENLRVSRRIGDTRVPLEALRGLAAIAGSDGDIETAAALSAAVDALLTSFGGTPSSAELVMEKRFLGPVRRSVGEAEWNRLSSPSVGITLEETLAWALGERSTPEPSSYAGAEVECASDCARP